MKPQVYIDERGAEGMVKYHRRVREHRPSAMYDIVRIMMTASFGTFDRVSGIDAHNVPRAGGTIFVPNHFSFIDHFFTGIHLRRKIQFMAKSQLFKPPMDFVYSHGGVFPVMRGKGDDEAFITAKAILERGGVVQMYAEGGRSRGYYPLTAKRGPGMLALETGAPVVPVAIYGSQFIRDVKRHGFPKVVVQYGAPLRFEPIENPTKEQQQAAAEEIFSRSTEMFWRLDAEYEPKWRRLQREQDPSTGPQAMAPSEPPPDAQS